MKATEMSINRGMDKEDAAHRYNGILLSHKRNKIMPFAATWVNLEIIILSEVRERQTASYINVKKNYMSLFKNRIINKLIIETQKQICRHRKQIYHYQRVQHGGGSG